jgi:predicted MFS family arabinose efflux permease
MDSIYLFFAANYFAQGMSGIAYEPINYLLKDHFGLSAGQTSVFIAWMTLPFLIKPLLGFPTDLIPIRGRRRLPHILLASLMATGAWIFLAFRHQYTYGLLLLMLFLANIGIASSDVVCDAVMVERGKPLGLTGRYQAVQIGTLYLSLVATGLGGGWLAAHASYRQVFALTALFPLMILVSCVWIRETPTPPTPRLAIKEFIGLLKERRFWLLSLIIFLWNFYPFFGTVQFYFQSETLHLSPVFIGMLSTLGGFSGFLGAAFFWKAHGKLWNRDAMVKAGAMIGAVVSLLYFFYLGPVSVAIVEIIFGFTSVVLRLGLMDLLARSCPDRAEATSFALFMSVFDLAASASNTAGGKLYDALRAGLAGYSSPERMAAWILILIGSLCTLACWWLVPLVTREAQHSAVQKAQVAT